MLSGPVSLSAELAPKSLSSSAPRVRTIANPPDDDCERLPNQRPVIEILNPVLEGKDQAAVVIARSNNPIYNFSQDDSIY